LADKSIHWPDGKRIAVAVTAAFETWSDGKSPTYSVQATPVKAGTVDLAGVAWAGYGGKVGVWRLINLFNEHNIRGTFCVNARCAEIYPEAVAQIVKSGHNVAGHAYVQDHVLSAMSMEEEKATIQKSLRLLEGVTGVRPKGWVSPNMAYTQYTRDFMGEEGLLWHGDGRDTDVPRIADTKSGPIVHMPFSDFTDNRVLRSSSMDLWDVYRETFDYLYLREPGSFLVISMHCHFGGRPMITAIFHKIFSYMAQYPDVWFASLDDVADWVMQNKFAPDPRRLLKTERSAAHR
jgi:peptidoglycan/xylan/chitin deacetylase (PgdA/CDA1 family)